MKVGSEALRFLVAGAVNTLLTLLLYWGLLRFLSYAVAYTIAYVAGIGLAYWLNARFVFRVAASARTFAMFPLVYVVQYLLGLATLYAAVEWLGIPRAVAILVSIALTIPVTFVLSRTILKTPRPQTEERDRSADAASGRSAFDPRPSRRPMRRLTR